jgi:hypothetical protein
MLFISWTLCKICLGLSFIRIEEGVKFVKHFKGDIKVWEPLLYSLWFGCCWYCSCRCGETMSLNCGHQRAYCSYPRWYMSTESNGGMIFTGETKELGEKICPNATCPPQIQHGFRARAQASAVGGWWLTAWATGRSLHFSLVDILLSHSVWEVMGSATPGRLRNTELRYKKWSAKGLICNYCFHPNSNDQSCTNSSQPLQY